LERENRRAEQCRNLRCSAMLRTVQSPWKHGLSLLLKLIMMLAGAGLRAGPDPKDEDAGARTAGCRVSAAYPAIMSRGEKR
jgi:hypothetical protein